MKLTGPLKVVETVINVLSHPALLVICALLLLFPRIGTCAGQVEFLAQLSIEELMEMEVSSAGFFDMPAEKAPGTVWIVDGETVENSPAMDLAGLLDLHVPGIHITDNRGYGALYASRGMVMPNNATALFMLDGQRLNTGIGTGINSSLRLPLIGDMDRLEVINGPCSIVHGSGAINGFVNLIPKNGTDHQGGFSNFTYGVRDRMYRAETGYGFNYGRDKDLYIYAGAVRSAGIDVDGENGRPDSTAREFSEPSYRSAIYWNHGPASLNLFIQKEVYVGELLPEYGLDSAETYQQTAGIRPKFSLDITDTESLELSFPMELHDSGLTYKNTIVEEAGTEFHMEAEAIFRTTRFAGHELAVGGVLGKRHIDVGELSFRESPGQPLFKAETDIIEASFFFEDIYHPMPGWTISAGLRYDTSDYEDAKLEINFDEEILEGFIKQGKDQRLTPRLATSFELSPNSTLKFSYQQGFHYPSTASLLDLLQGPSKLQTEKMQSYEGNYRLRLPRYGLEFGINLYYNIFDDTLFAVIPEEGENGTMNDNGEPPKDASFINSDDCFASLGGELSIRWKPDQMTDIRFSYGYSRPLSISDEERNRFFLTDDDRSEWTGYPAHIVKGGITRHLMDRRLSVNLSMLYNSPVQTDRDEDLSLDRYDHHRFIVDAMARFRITDNLSVKLVGQNIFRNDVPAAGYYNNPGISEFPSTEEPLYYIGLNWTY